MSFVQGLSLLPGCSQHGSEKHENPVKEPRRSFGNNGKHSDKFTRNTPDSYILCRHRYVNVGRPPHEEIGGRSFESMFSSQ